MKRIAAILLLGIFTFNLFGYRLVASFLESRENERIEIALDGNNYSDDELISIKQATNLPYYRNSETFQRIDGEIEIAGVFYKYVKCRIYNDSLELMCIPNTGKMKIRAAKDDFSGLASEYQQTPDSKKKSQSENKSLKQILGDYEVTQQLSIAGGFKPTHLRHLLQNCDFVNNLFLTSAERPPDSPAFIS